MEEEETERVFSNGDEAQQESGSKGQEKGQCFDEVSAA